MQGNKNAALPLVAATLLTRGRFSLRGAPSIVDVHNLLGILEALDVKTGWNDQALEIDTRGLARGELPATLVEKLRGAVLLLGPLAAEFEEVACALPGGCPIGRRSFDVHWSTFRACGFEVTETPREIRLRRVTRVADPSVFLVEASVTATENALLLMAALGGGEIQNPAREPHVLTLIDFLRLLGCEIELHPLYYRVHRGVERTGPRRLHAPDAVLEFPVPADYIDAGTLAIAAAVTGGEVFLKGVTPRELQGIQPVLEEFGLRFQWRAENNVQVSPGDLTNASRLTAGPWPLFPTDLVSLCIVLATQGSGLCLIHDWMYEARMFFVDKLVRMGAHITMCDPHRVLVHGPSLLRGTRLESPDIRAGMALVVAGLSARGTTTIEHAEVILRGYEGVAERLRFLGAEIAEVEEMSVSLE